jgi:hypothetical protein
MRILGDTNSHTLEKKQVKVEPHSAGEHPEISVQVVLKGDGSQISMFDTKRVLFARKSCGKRARVHHHHHYVVLKRSQRSRVCNQVVRSEIFSRHQTDISTIIKIVIERMISKYVMRRPRMIDTRDPGSEKVVVKRLIKKRKSHRKAKRRSNGDFF